MGRRDLLSAEERRLLFGVPVERDVLAQRCTFDPGDLELIHTRREDRNRLGFAVQLTLLRHPGLTLAQVLAQPGADLTPLVGFVAGQLRVPAAAFDGYATRDQTMSDHAREVAEALGLRPAVRADLALMIEAAASAAWATDALLRTVQRRLKIWRAEIARELVFGTDRRASDLMPPDALRDVETSRVGGHQDPTADSAPPNDDRREHLAEATT